ncbi:S-methyl-5'-thioadenosine phosphorylase [Chloroflexota bacterium]
MPEAKIGVIGGSGLYNIEGMEDVEEVNIDTPFGKPSDAITVGKLGGVGIAFLPRHGKGHRISPSELNARANIYAMKSLGVEHIIAVCSAGSFKEEIKPGHLLIPDQLIDRTRTRVSTYFTDGIVAHVQFADPFCPDLSKILYEAAVEAGAYAHHGGSFVVMEGPAFSTRAESKLYRSWGADLIGMTALPEAKLAREAEICYAIIGCATDYDAWHESLEAVTIDVVLETMRHNIDTAKSIIKLAVSRIAEERKCICANALAMAIVTSPDAIPPETKKKLELIIGKYIK